MTSTAAVVGRDRELAALTSALGVDERLPAVVLLEGEAGIGKTTLWRLGIELAGDRFRVLTSSPSGAETQLSYAAVGDLLDGVALEEVLDSLSEPQRRALRVALLFEEPSERPTEPRAVAVAVLNVLRLLARRSPLLVAIDDVQWLDAASAVVLAYATRRLRGEPIALLLARRLEGAESLPLELDRVPAERDFVRVAVGPLTLGALRHLLHERIGSSFPRPTLRRLHDVSGGNPLYALELARALESQGGRLDAGAELPLPRDLAALLRARLAPLPRETFEALLAAAAVSAPTVPLLDAAVGGVAVRTVLEPAVDAGMIEIADERIRFTHPLLASAVYAHADRRRRRECHRRLAELVADTEERARHLALAAEAPDAAVAAVLEEAARGAFARGAVESAAALGDQALQFTPHAEADALQRRRLAAVEYLARAGSKVRAREVIDAARMSAQPGPERARIALTATWFGVLDTSARIEALREAVEDARADAPLLIKLHSALAHILLYSPDLRGAEHHAAVALELAEQAGDDPLLVVALLAVAEVDFFAGRGLDMERVDRARALEAVAGNPYGNVSLMGGFLGVTLSRSGELDAARRILEAKVAEERRRADVAVGWTLQELARVEIQAGDWRRAQALAEESTEVGRDVGDAIQTALVNHRLALLAVLRGEVPAARALAAEGLRLAALAGSPLTRAELSGALGLLELSLGNARTALSHLEEAARFAAEAGFGDPGILPFVPDRVEALLATGDLETAEAATAELELQGRRLQRRLALAGAARCRGLLAAARGELAGAVETLEAARAETACVGQPFELARTLLALGTVQRRARQKRAARETLTEALTGFDRLGARLWSEQARSQLARIGGRAPSAGELTPSEQRIAELVAEGKTNKEVAAMLVVADRTVESALTQIYRKLDVRSRTQLARKLAGVG